MTRRSALTVGLILGGLTFGADGALAETPEQRQACMDSAFQVCSQYIPDREQVVACLIRNKDTIQPLCREALAPYIPPDPVPVKQASKIKPKGAPKAAPKGPTRTAARTTTKPNSKKVAAPLSLNPKAR